MTNVFNTDERGKETSKNTGANRNVVLIYTMALVASHQQNKSYLYKC
jgi:hypothetical protein